MNYWYWILLPVICAGFPGCTAVGPDYGGAPQRELEASFVRAEGNTVLGQPSAAWWRELKDPVLDGLITDAMTHNDSVRIAISRLEQGRALLSRRRAEQGPEGGAEGSYERKKPNLIQFGVDSTDNEEIDLYFAGIDASWELDLFGGKRRATEAARAMAEGAEATLDDVRVSIASEVAQAYIHLRQLQIKLDHINRLASADQRLIKLTEQRVEEGVASELELGRVRYQWRTTIADEPLLRGAVTIQMDRLAVLTGRDPGTLDALLDTNPVIPLPPDNIVLADPASTLRMRPDIRAAERMLAAATAGIGVETASLFPEVTFNGEIGFSSIEFDSLGEPDSNIFSIGPSISWDFLELNRVRARIARADAVREEMLVRYEQVLRRALQDTEASLVRLARSRETVVARQATLKAAQGAAELIEQRYEEGHLSLMDAITARQNETRANERLLVAQGDLTKAYIAVQKSLGLAWVPTGESPRSQKP